MFSCSLPHSLSSHPRFAQFNSPFTSLESICKEFHYNTKLYHTYHWSDILVDNDLLMIYDNYTSSGSKCQPEHELEAELLCIWIPMGPIPEARIVALVFDFTRRDSESYGFVWFSSNLWNLVSTRRKWGHDKR